jgi:hypothetical protein
LDATIMHAPASVSAEVCPPHAAIKLEHVTTAARSALDIPQDFVEMFVFMVDIQRNVRASYLVDNHRDKLGVRRASLCRWRGRNGSQIRRRTIRLPDRGSP